MRDLAPRPGSMLANRSPNKTRALCCREITRGLARGGNTTEGGFLLDTRSPTQIIVSTRVRRSRLGDVPDKPAQRPAYEAIVLWCNGMIKPHQILLRLVRVEGRNDREFLRQKANAGSEDGNGGDEVQGTVIKVCMLAICF